MSQNAAAPRSDQAVGLRAIFGDGLARIWCLASALTPDATVFLGLGTAHALRHAGHRTLLIDEVPLPARNTLSGFSYPVRYDVGQVLTNSIGLDRAIRPVQENLWFATGVKVQQAFASKRVRGPSLVQRLVQAEIDIDFVLIATCEPFANSLSLYGQDIQRIVVVAPDDASLRRGMSMLRELSVMSGGAATPVLVVGGEDAEVGKAAFARLEQASTSVLQQPLEMMGWIRAASVSSFASDDGGDSGQAGMVLPVSVYKAMAGTIGRLPNESDAG